MIRREPHYLALVALTIRLRTLRYYSSRKKPRIHEVNWTFDLRLTRVFPFSSFSSLFPSNSDLGLITIRGMYYQQISSNI